MTKFYIIYMTGQNNNTQTPQVIDAQFKSITDNVQKSKKVITKWKVNPPIKKQDDAHSSIYRQVEGEYYADKDKEVLKHFKKGLGWAGKATLCLAITGAITLSIVNTNKVKATPSIGSGVSERI